MQDILEDFHILSSSLHFIISSVNFNPVYTDCLKKSFMYLSQTVIKKLIQINFKPWHSLGLAFHQQFSFISVIKPSYRVESHYTYI